MRNFDTKALQVEEQAKARPERRTRKQLELTQCLVVSASAARQELLARGAAESGWQTIVCGDAADAFACMARMFVQLAMIDLQDCASNDFRNLVEKLAPTAGLLLIVCGNEDNIQEEIWVRQLGAWLYLPGVVESSDVSLLCSEARHIAQRLKTLNHNLVREER